MRGLVDENGEIIKTDEVYKGHAFSVDVDELRSKSGLVFERSVVKHSHSIVVLPLDFEDNVVLVRQYRHPTETYLLEAPAGKLEKNESPNQCAQRELQEEIGYTSDSIEYMGGFWIAPGFCNEYMHSYIVF